MEPHLSHSGHDTEDDRKSDGEQDIQQDMKSLRLKKEHTANRKKWRGRIQVADPFPMRN